MDKSFKQQLKAKAHHIKPVIIIGAKGLTDAVLEETNNALTAHELIKIKLKGMEKSDKKTAADTICSSLGAELVQMIGNTIVIYRPKPEDN